MPELAEVETVRRGLERRVSGLRICHLMFDELDPYLFQFASGSLVQKALLGARIIGTGRKGKYFWLELDQKPWPIFHLGMTGNIAIANPQAQDVWQGAQLWSSRKHVLADAKAETQKLPKFCRLLLRIEGGQDVAFLDPRRFGRIWLAENPWEHPRVRALGYDPLIDFPEIQILVKRLGCRKKAIKSVLLDQSLFAGVGNWLADEILYQAKLSPHHLASALSVVQIKQLRKSVLHVVNQAVDVEADYSRFPKSWLFHHRWGSHKNAQTSRGQAIVRETIGGRTTAWVRGWQT